jgi:hypothetical protein
MFVKLSEWKKYFIKEIVDKFIIHQHINFQASNSNSLLVITAKQNGTYNMCSDIYILLCILQKKYLNKSSTATQNFRTLHYMAPTSHIYVTA